MVANKAVAGRIALLVVVDRAGAAAAGHDLTAGTRGRTRLVMRNVAGIGASHASGGD